MTETLACQKHGEQNEAIVYSRPVQTIADRIPRGLIWSRDDDGSINAYYIGCKDMLDAAGGDWSEELQEKARLGIVREVCLLSLFDLNGTPRPA